MRRRYVILMVVAVMISVILLDLLYICAILPTRAKDQALIEATRSGSSSSVNLRLLLGADANARRRSQSMFGDGGGYTSLMIASASGNQDIVRTLLAHGADPNLKRRERNALYFAVASDHKSIVQMLKNAGAEGDPKLMRLTSLLLRAACRGFAMEPGEGYPFYPGCLGDPTIAPKIREVILLGVDVNAANVEGYTALMYAANLGLIDNVNLLLELGADPLLKCKKGETALDLAERANSSVNRIERQEVAIILRQVIEAN